MLSNDDINIIADLIEEEIENRLNEAFNEFGQQLKEYVDSSINRSNRSILQDNVNHNGNQYDEETKKTKKISLRENLRNIIESSSDEEYDNDDQMSFTSNDARGFGAMRGGNTTQLSPMHIKAMLPPDEGVGGGMATQPLQPHSNSLLDVAGALPDESLAAALTKNYSGMFKKK